MIAHNFDGTVSLTGDYYHDTTSTDTTTICYSRCDIDETQTFDNRSSRSLVRNESIDISSTPVRVKRPPTSRKHFEAIKIRVGPSKGVTKVHFNPRYRARSRPWTGKNYRK